MAKATVKSGLAGKLGSKLTEAINETKDNETVLPGGGSLPAGIENGVARLVDCRFGQYKEGTANAGEYFFYAAGVMVAGVDGSGLPVAGLRTSLGPEPIMDTPTRSRPTIKDHVDWVLNELRKLGADTSTMADGADLEPLAAAVLEAAPYFRVTTFKPDKRVIVKKAGKFYLGNDAKGYPTEAALKAANKYWNQEPTVMETWRGIIEGYTEDGDATDGVNEDGAVEEEVVEEDAAEEAEAEEGEVSLDDLAAIADGCEDPENPTEDEQAAQTAIGEAAQALGIDPTVIDTWTEVVEAINAASGEEEAAEEEGGAEEGEDEGVDYEALGAQADEGDEDAIAQLTEYAGTAGLDINDYGPWADLAAALLEMVSGEGEEEAEEEAAEPEVGSVVTYKPPGAKKEQECTVTAVAAAKRQVTLKNNTTKVPYKNVSFDAVALV